MQKPEYSTVVWILGLSWMVYWWIETKICSRLSWQKKTKSFVLLMVWTLDTIKVVQLHKRRMEQLFKVWSLLMPNQVRIDHRLNYCNRTVAVWKYEKKQHLEKGKRCLHNLVDQLHNLVDLHDLVDLHFVIG